MLDTSVEKHSMKRFVLPIVGVVLLGVVAFMLLQHRHAEQIQASKDRATIIRLALQSACTQSNTLAYEDGPGCEGRYKASGISVIMEGTDKANVYFGLHDVNIVVVKDSDGKWFTLGPQGSSGL